MPEREIEWMDYTEALLADQVAYGQLEVYFEDLLPHFNSSHIVGILVAPATYLELSKLPNVDSSPFRYTIGDYKIYVRIHDRYSQ